MLQIKSIERGFELKNNQQKVVLDEPTVSLGEAVITKPGEYEAGGVEVVYGQSSALVVWDNLQIVFIFSTEKPTAFEKSQFSPCDVVVFGSQIAKLEKAHFNETLELFDPKVVILGSKTDISEVQSTIKTEPVDSGKLAVSTLPEEGRDFILLS